MAKGRLRRLHRKRRKPRHPQAPREGREHTGVHRLVPQRRCRHGVRASCQTWGLLRLHANPDRRRPRRWLSRRPRLLGIWHAERPRRCLCSGLVVRSNPGSRVRAQSFFLDLQLAHTRLLPVRKPTADPTTPLRTPAATPVSPKHTLAFAVQHHAAQRAARWLNRAPPAASHWPLLALTGPRGRRPPGCGRCHERAHR